MLYIEEFQGCLVHAQPLYRDVGPMKFNDHSKVSNIRRTNSQNLNASRLIL